MIKCPHGVYAPDGDTRYCQTCHPPKPLSDEEIAEAIQRRFTHIPMPCPSCGQIALDWVSDYDVRCKKCGFEY